MIVSLPMYTSTPATVQALWGYLSAHLREAGLRNVPDTLTWPLEMLGHWRNPSLLLSQACGYPLVTELRNQVRVIGTFRYGVPGCQGGFCRSAMVVRHDDIRTGAVGHHAGQETFQPGTPIPIEDDYRYTHTIEARQRCGIGDGWINGDR